VRTIAGLLWAFVVSGGCRSRPAANGIAQLYGEVHIHGFAGGFHPAATFIWPGVPASEVNDDSIVSPAAPPRAACSLARSTDARPDAAPPVALDAGVLRLRGGHGVPELALAFQRDSHSYLWAGDLPHSPLFLGGEPITIEGEGHGPVPSFRGILRAPSVLELLTGKPLEVGNGRLAVSWKPGDAERIVLSLVASKQSGEWTVIRCRASDETGRFEFPEALLAELPPPPRELQLYVSREELVRVGSTDPSRGVLLHASYATKLSASEP
jgi:hypothetical protein